jgi:rhamnosyltransferase
MRVTTEDSISAIIVTFYPDDRFFEMLESIAKQVDNIWIVDNGSIGLSRDKLEGLVNVTHTSLKLISNDENLGLATAQNQGIKEAINLGSTWILLLDQDSIPANDMIEKMMSAAEGYEDKECLGMITPRHEDDDGTPSIPSYSAKYGFRLHRYFMKVNDVDDMLAFGLASGSLIPSKVLQKVGLMRDDFWIDYIDYDFSFRLRKLGYKIIGVGAASLRHRLGESFNKHVGNIKLTYRAHPAFRRYTIYRNRIRVIREYGLEFPNFLIFEVLSISKDFMKLVFIEDKKKKKFNAILSGIIDGISGRGGLRKF